MADEDWLSAAEAFRLVSAVIGKYEARRAICGRAFAGLIEARATRFIDHRRSVDNKMVPKQFWWARGEAALTQNWATGDFETWIDRTIHLRAFGVSFSRKGIEALTAPTKLVPQDSASNATNQGGRPSAAWWDELWIEICRQLWQGELNPEKQSHIKAAMMNWASSKGHNPAESTVRQRARRLWRALNHEGEN